MYALKAGFKNVRLELVHENLAKVLRGEIEPIRLNKLTTEMHVLMM